VTGRNILMQEVAQVSNVENADKLKIYLEESFKKARYWEITQAIGMHSLFIDPQHTMKDQTKLYHGILQMLKDRISKNTGKKYGAWYESFPGRMDKLLSSKQVVTSASSVDVLASRQAAYGAFKSVDDFFFWALDDRRLPLDQIVKYIEKTADTGGK
jgi:hypothetical protein